MEVIEDFETLAQLVYTLSRILVGFVRSAAVVWRKFCSVKHQEAEVNQLCCDT